MRLQFRNTLGVITSLPSLVTYLPLDREKWEAPVGAGFGDRAALEHPLSMTSPSPLPKG